MSDSQDSRLIDVLVGYFLTSSENVVEIIKYVGSSFPAVYICSIFKVKVKTSADCTVTCEGAEKTNNDKEFLIKEQGNYTIQAVDENGKLLAKTTIQVGNIDNKPPEIS